jgi:hypothetical protein
MELEFQVGRPDEPELDFSSKTYLCPAGNITTFFVADLGNLEIPLLRFTGLSLESLTTERPIWNCCSRCATVRDATTARPTRTPHSSRALQEVPDV